MHRVCTFFAFLFCRMGNNYFGTFMQVYLLYVLEPYSRLTPCTFCPKPFPIMQNRKVIDKWEMHFMKSFWSKLVIIDWLCGINCWFLLGFAALVFVYLWSWDAIIGGKNPCSDCRNYFHCNTCSNYSACNPWPWAGWTRYVQCTLTRKLCVSIIFRDIFRKQSEQKIFYPFSKL